MCNEHIFRNGSFRELKIAKESNALADLEKVVPESYQKSNEFSVNRKNRQNVATEDGRTFADKDKVRHIQTLGNDNKDVMLYHPLLLLGPKRIIKPSLKGRENLRFTIDDPVLNNFIDFLSVFSHSFRFPKFYTLKQQWEMSCFLLTLHELLFRLATCLKQLNALSTER